ncbi:hypothetical protein BpHYR1_046258 [Brachionus plicatilis]|uniref:Uncharacterized protein n=1 Tax=Brachionus plicatilis TaxID=10195 RepID=A0A3M7S592_BRAPC|nr:hypothetical protein BpHYR1_046258 [Brachionus plicatilis]
MKIINCIAFHAMIFFFLFGFGFWPKKKIKKINQVLYSFALVVLQKDTNGNYQKNEIEQNFILKNSLEVKCCIIKTLKQFGLIFELEKDLSSVMIEAKKFMWRKIKRLILKKFNLNNLVTKYVIADY